MTALSPAGLAARAQAWWHTRVTDPVERQRGQGTVEYVGIVVTIAILLGAVAASSKGWGNDIGNSLKTVIKNAISLVSKPGGGQP